MLFRSALPAVDISSAAHDTVSSITLAASANDFGGYTFPVVGLPGYDLETGSAAGLTATVTSLAAGLPLAQLSNAFSTHGVYPPHGAPIGAGDLPAEVTGSGNRVAVTLPVQAAAPYGAWGTFTYTVTDEKSGESAEGLVTVVPPHGILVGSDFAADATMSARPYSAAAKSTRNSSGGPGSSFVSSSLKGSSDSLSDMVGGGAVVRARSLSSHGANSGDRRALCRERV